MLQGFTLLSLAARGFSSEFVVNRYGEIECMFDSHGWAFGLVELDRHYQKHPNLFDQLHHKRQGGLLACGGNRKIWLPLLLVVDIICPLFSETRRSQVLKSDVQHRLSSLALYSYGSSM